LKIDTSRAALLGIDIQNDFCPGGALAVKQGDETVAGTNALMDRLSMSVLTQDWHPADHMSFAENNDGKEPFSLIEASYGPQVLWPTHCVQGTQGAEFHSDLNVDRANLIIRKGYRSAIDSYSGFFENDKSTPTGLDGFLKEQGITTLFLTGIASDYCVYYSAIDAKKAGYEVYFVEDCCRGIDLEGSLDSAMTDMRNNGISFASSAEIMASL